jgi:hypothetical protein
MDDYLNFTLLGEAQRFHILLPWQNSYSVGFYAIDEYLQGNLPEALYERTRQLRISKHQPESNSIDFHRWQRQCKMQDFHAYTQQLDALKGGLIQQVGITAEGVTYLIITQAQTELIFRVAPELPASSGRMGYLSITLQPDDLRQHNDLFRAL